MIFSNKTFVRIVHFGNAHKYQNLSFLRGKMNQIVKFSLHNCFQNLSSSEKSFIQNMIRCKRIDSESDALLKT